MPWAFARFGHTWHEHNAIGPVLKGCEIADSNSTIRAVSVVITAVLLCFATLALAGSTSTTTTIVKDGEKITTKVKTDNKGISTTTVTIKDKDGTVTTTTTVAQSGNIISTDDPEARAKASFATKERQEKQAALASAPKQGAPTIPSRWRSFRPS